MRDFVPPELRRVDHPGGDWRIYRGESMFRVFSSGDLLRVEPLLARNAAVGDVICFDDPRQGAVVHRIIAVDSSGKITTMGDNNARPDDYRLAPDAVVFRVRCAEDRQGKTSRVFGGVRGMAEFKLHRLRRRLRLIFGKCCGVVRRIGYYKFPLTRKVTFGADEIFYFRNHPAARRCTNGTIRWFSPWFKLFFRIGDKNR